MNVAVGRLHLTIVVGPTTTVKRPVQPAGESAAERQFRRNEVMKMVDGDRTRWRNEHPSGYHLPY